jgi:hypothetical protein
MDVREIYVHLSLVNNDELKKKESVCMLDKYYKYNFLDNRRNLKRLKEDPKAIANIYPILF